jgi:hypothetical protein
MILVLLFLAYACTAICAGAALLAVIFCIFRLLQFLFDF